MSLWDQLFNTKKTPIPPTVAAPKTDNRAETSSGYMDPKWQNPTAKWDPVTKNIVQNPSTPTSSPVVAPKTSSVATSAVQAPIPSTPLPDPRNDLNPLYDSASKRIADMNSGLQGDFDKAIAAIMSQYERSSGDIYNRYMGTRSELDSSAAALGAKGEDIYKNYDPALRRVQENSDLQRNASTDLLNTLKTLRGQQSVDIQASLEQQRAKAIADQTAQWVDLLAQVEQAKAAGSSSGGSGGGGRSGGGSSGSAKEAATMTEQLYSVGDIEAYNELMKTNPAAAAVYLSSLQKSTGSPLIKQLATQADEIAKVNPYVAPKKSSGSGWASPALNKIFGAAANVATGVNTARKNQNQATIQAAIQAAMRNSGLMGNPTNTAKITSTSSRKT